MRILILLFIFISFLLPFSLKANECSKYIDNNYDYPIEKDYPNFKVRVGVIQRSSLVFKKWRRLTHRSIPDTAFNWHFYTEEQRMIAAGYSSESIALFKIGNKFKNYFTEEGFNGGNVKLLQYTFVSTNSIDFATSGVGLLSYEKMQTLMRTEVRYKFLIDVEGRIYVLPDQSIHRNAAQELNQEKFLDVGWVTFKDDKIIVEKHKKDDGRGFLVEKYFDDYCSYLEPKYESLRYQNFGEY